MVALGTGAWWSAAQMNGPQANYAILSLDLSIPCYAFIHLRLQVRVICGLAAGGALFRID